MEQKERILAHAQKVFTRYGPRSVTLDDIAKELGISKKTIYHYFQNKAHMVYEVALTHLKEEMQLLEDLQNKSQNAVEELVNILNCTYRDVEQMSPNLITEVQKYYPDSWELFEIHTRESIFQMVKSNLERGIREGLFRNDLHVDIVAKIRIWQIEAGFNQDVFPPTQYDSREILLQLLKLYMHGIVTVKGKQLLEELQSELTPYHPLDESINGTELYTHISKNLDE